MYIYSQINMLSIQFLESMGSLFIEIGQCGCQIGVPLNQKLSSSYYCTRLRPPNRMHAIMVDTQPKVIKQIVDRNPRWLDSSNLKYFQYGRGNNWSYGYLHELPPHPLHNDKLPKNKQFSHVQPATLEKYLTQNKQIAGFVIEKMRTELETVDCAMAVNVIGSLGGGTGSGLGTKLVECIRQEFNLDIYSHLVLPNKSGESPLQVYNCLLSLSSLFQNSSAIFTYENDKMMNHFQNIDQKETTLQQINDHLANNISRLIKINDLPKYDRFYNNIVSECVLSSQLKFLNLFGIQAKKGKWDQYMPRLMEQIKNYQSDAYGEEFVSKPKREKLLHGELFLTGTVQSNFEQKYGKKFRNIVNPMSTDSLNVEEFIVKGKQQTGEAILVSNHSSITHYLGYLINSGLKKYEAGAYLWHYQYADIEGALDVVQNIHQQYYYCAHG